MRSALFFVATVCVVASGARGVAAPENTPPAASRRGGDEISPESLDAQRKTDDIVLIALPPASVYPAVARVAANAGLVVLSLRAEDHTE